MDGNRTNARLVLLRGFRQILALLVVVIDHAAVGQRQVGKEMMRADHAAHREIGHRRVDMRHEMQPSRPDPRALDDDIGEIDCDELGDFGMPVDTPGSASD